MFRFFRFVNWKFFFTDTQFINIYKFVLISDSFFMISFFIILNKYIYNEEKQLYFIIIILYITLILF